MKRWIICLSLLLTITFAFTACGNRATVAPPTTPATSLLKQIATGNDILANSNQQMGITVTNLATTGVMSVDTALTLKRINVEVAQMDNQLTPILDAINNGTVNWANASAILNSITTMLNNGISSAKLGIKNPQAQTQVVAALQTVSGVAQALISEIVQVQALEAQANVATPAPAPAAPATAPAK